MGPTTEGKPLPAALLADVSDLAAPLPWQLVLDNTIVGISYMRDRRFLWANGRMAEIFGYAPGELDGEPVRRLYATQQDYEAVGRLMQQATPDRFVTHERGMSCKDGTLVWCRISGRLLSANRQGSASVWVVQDLSDKKRAEDQARRLNQRLEQTVARRTLNLRRTNVALHAEVERGRQLQAAVVASREKYRMLFRHMPFGVLVMAPDGTVTEANRMVQNWLGAPSRRRLEALLKDETRVPGRTSGHATGHANGHANGHAGGHDQATGSLQALLLDRAEASRAQSRACRFEFGWLRPSGRRREFTAIAATLSASDEGTVFTLEDVTDQLRRREQEHEQQALLSHASRLSLMGQMASALAHELGQPLNACQSYLAGLRHRLQHDPAAAPDLLGALDKATHHLDQAGAILGNVRGFVSRHRPEQEATDLPALVSLTLQLLELPLRRSRAWVDVQADPAMPAVRCHPVEIQQVLVNLIVNAIEAMSATPVHDRAIRVRIAADDGAGLVVEVSDRGPGVDAALAARIFDPYVTSKPAGLGMGLMISRTLVESHGGQLRHLRPRGGGATFRFTLPIADAPSAASPSAPSASAASPSATSPATTRP